MLIEVERVREFSWSPFPVVQVQTPVGRTAVTWRGPRNVSPGPQHVEWTVDLPVLWSARAIPGVDGTPAILRAAAERRGAVLPGSHCVILRGQLQLTPDGAGILDLGGAPILLDFAAPAPPPETDGTWVQAHVPHQHIGLYPYEL